MCKSCVSWLNAEETTQLGRKATREKGPSTEPRTRTLPDAVAHVNAQESRSRVLGSIGGPFPRVAFLRAVCCCLSPSCVLLLQRLNSFMMIDEFLESTLLNKASYVKNV